MSHGPSLSAHLAFATYAAHPTITDDDRLVAAALSALGCTVDAHPWDASIAWSAFDAVLPRSTWDFHRRLPEFRAWLDRLDAAGTPTLNASVVLRWNLTKRYLTALAARGIAVVPTLWYEPAHAADHASRPALGEAIAARGWRDGAVVKPIVSASGYGTWTTIGSEPRAANDRFRRALADTPDGLMVQPFLTEVQAQGEWSLMFLGGRFSHAVIKRPADGEFRVQAEHGGVATPARAAPRLIEDAARALGSAAACTDRCAGDIVYARVDGVHAGGRLLLMELELLEPALHLDADPAAPGRMATAIVEALGR